jgi:hypothetical protein
VGHWDTVAHAEAEADTVGLWETVAEFEAFEAVKDGEAVPEDEALVLFDADAVDVAAPVFVFEAVPEGAARVTPPPSGALTLTLTEAGEVPGRLVETEVEAGAATVYVVTPLIVFTAVTTVPGFTPGTPSREEPAARVPPLTLVTDRMLPEMEPVRVMPEVVVAGCVSVTVWEGPRAGTATVYVVTPLIVFTAVTTVPGSTPGTPSREEPAARVPPLTLVTDRVLPDMEPVRVMPEVVVAGCVSVTVWEGPASVYEVTLPIVVTPVTVMVEPSVAPGTGTVAPTANGVAVLGMVSVVPVMVAVTASEKEKGEATSACGLKSYPVFAMPLPGTPTVYVPAPPLVPLTKPVISVPGKTPGPVTASPTFSGIEPTTVSTVSVLPTMAPEKTAPAGFASGVLGGTALAIEVAGETTVPEVPLMVRVPLARTSPVAPSTLHSIGGEVGVEVKGQGSIPQQGGRPVLSTLAIMVEVDLSMSASAAGWLSELVRTTPVLLKPLVSTRRNTLLVRAAGSLRGRRPSAWSAALGGAPPANTPPLLPPPPPPPPNHSNSARLL